MGKGEESPSPDLCNKAHHLDHDCHYGFGLSFSDTFGSRSCSGTMVFVSSLTYLLYRHSWHAAVAANLAVVLWAGVFVSLNSLDTQ